MLTPDYLEHCADDIIELYTQLDESIIRDIARRIVKTGDITETARWQIEKVQQGGLLYDDVIAEIAKITDASENHVRTLFEDAGIKSVEYDNAIYEKAGLAIPPTRMSMTAYQVLLAGAAKTNGNLKNLTMTTANTAQSAFINACTLAEMQIESGAFNYQTAIRNAVIEAAKRGNTVLYPSGHVDKLDVAVRRAVMTGVSQTTGRIGMQNALDMGCDLMEITAHSGARPSHAVWQGQIVSLSGARGYLSLSDIGYGDGGGFKGWNCRHDWFPFFEGISQRAYSDSDLQALENETVTYNGKSYTEYGATQVQRAMEREIRSTRRQLVALDELIQNGDTAAKAEFESLSVKLKSQEAKLKDFCQSTDRRVDTFRVQVNGFDKSVSHKAVWAEKKTVAKVSESGISSKVNSANSENSVDLEYILSREYHDKFKGITGDYKIDEQIYKQSRAMLIHRSKTDKEDMCLIDSRTGKIAGRQTHSKPDFYVEYNDSLNNAIKNTPRDTLISIHNHPTNNPPTGSDIVSNGSNGYKLGVVVTHNGKVFIYKAGNIPFSAFMFGKSVDKYKGEFYNLNEYNAIIKTLKDFEKSFGIYWSECL